MNHAEVVFSTAAEEPDELEDQVSFGESFRVLLMLSYKCEIFVIKVFLTMAAVYGCLMGLGAILADLYGFWVGFTAFVVSIASVTVYVLYRGLSFFFEMFFGIGPDGDDGGGQRVEKEAQEEVDRLISELKLDLARSPVVERAFLFSAKIIFREKHQFKSQRRSGKNFAFSLDDWF